MKKVVRYYVAAKPEISALSRIEGPRRHISTADT
jgi:hypothetical protein